MTRRRRLTAPQAQRAWRAYAAVPLRLGDVDMGRAMALAVDLGLYAYDAYMLELARHRGLPLLTLDRRMKAAALTSGLTLVEY